MSEPTKEREHVLMADLAGSRQRIRDQDEKIASLERQLAEAKSLIEAHRKAWQAALAPAALAAETAPLHEKIASLEKQLSPAAAVPEAGALVRLAEQAVQAGIAGACDEVWRQLQYKQICVEAQGAGEGRAAIFLDRLRALSPSGDARKGRDWAGPRWRKDGWPLCPFCGEDELFSSNLSPTAKEIGGCYRCNWRPDDPVNLSPPSGDARSSGEVNEHEDLELVLFRPVGRVYRVLRCKVCQSEDTFGISLADNGQWNLECGNCYEVAAVLSEVLAKLR